MGQHVMYGTYTDLIASHLKEKSLQCEILQ